MGLYEEPEKLKQLDLLVRKIKNKFQPVAVLIDNYSDGCFSFDLFDNLDLKNSEYSITIIENRFFEIKDLNKTNKYDDIQIDASSIKEIWHIIFYLIDKFNFNHRKHFNGRELFVNQPKNYPKMQWRDEKWVMQAAQKEIQALVDKLNADSPNYKPYSISRLICYYVEIVTKSGKRKVVQRNLCFSDSQEFLFGIEQQQEIHDRLNRNFAKPELARFYKNRKTKQELKFYDDNQPYWQAFQVIVNKYIPVLEYVNTAASSLYSDKRKQQVFDSLSLEQQGLLWKIRAA